MTTTFMLRVASTISALFTIGHSLGGLQNWSPFENNPVLEAMTATHFQAMGVSRSYLQLYVGLGWTLSVFMALQTVLLWQIASFARTNLALARAMTVPFILATLMTGLIAWRLILPVPALFSAALLVALLCAWLAERRAAA
jgi:hypothetical protein